jgi:hypothetical protein
VLIEKKSGKIAKRNLTSGRTLPEHVERANVKLRENKGEGEL